MQGISLFVDGECHEGAGADMLAERLCAQERLVADPPILQSDPAMALLATLYNQGSIAFAPED